MDLPALCLTAAAITRPGVADHVAEIVATAPADAITVSELSRTGHLDGLATLRPRLGWPATHAATRTLAAGVPILTVEPARYVGIGLDVLAL